MINKVFQLIDNISNKLIKSSTVLNIFTVLLRMNKNLLEEQQKEDACVPNG